MRKISKISTFLTVLVDIIPNLSKSCYISNRRVFEAHFHNHNMRLRHDEMNDTDPFEGLGHRWEHGFVEVVPKYR